jgi:ATP-binding cassette subfamily D (ALD) long-chain fatty acid import protein
MFAYKDLLELAGLTIRLYVLLSTLHNVKPLPLHAGGEDDPIELSHVDVAIPQNGHSDDSGFLRDDDSLSESEERGSSRPLVKDLSFVLREGEHLMITGSNGVGKTAVARVLAGLWAPQGARAKMGRPGSTNQKSIFVIPQRAYMVTGSLLDQMIYPHSYPEFLQSGTTLEDMMEILRKVHLEYLPEREGGWRTRKEWRDVLSGGEKQRVRPLTPFPPFPPFYSHFICTDGHGSCLLSQTKIRGIGW